MADKSYGMSSVTSLLAVIGVHFSYLSLIAMDVNPNGIISYLYTAIQSILGSYVLAQNSMNSGMKETIIIGLSMLVLLIFSSIVFHNAKKDPNEKGDSVATGIVGINVSVYTLLSIVLGYVLPALKIPAALNMPISSVVTVAVGITLTAISSKNKEF